MKARHLVPVLLLVPACGGGTAPATQVANIEATTLDGFPDALGEATGELTTTSWRLTYDPPAGPIYARWQPATLRIDVEHGPTGVDLGYDGAPSTLPIPHAVRVVVEDSGRFNVEIECKDALRFYDPDASSSIMDGSDEAMAILSRPGVSLRCEANLKRGGGNTRFRFAAFGDGVVLAYKIFGDAIEVSEIETD